MKKVFLRDGAVFFSSMLDQESVKRLNDIIRPKANRILEFLDDKVIGIGSKNGYREVVQRSPDRFDIRFEEKEFESIWGLERSTSDAVPWIKVIREVLGEESRSSFCGIVFSRPGAPSQQWHIDSLHESEPLRPAHALNVFVALEDVAEMSGPTEVAIGSHEMTNHLRNTNLNSKDLLYQTPVEISPSSLGNLEKVFDTKAFSMRAGDCLIFDDRILHRGLANRGKEERWMAYFSYMRPRSNLDKVRETHFESDRSLFD